MVVNPGVEDGHRHPGTVQAAALGALSSDRSQVIIGGQFGSGRTPGGTIHLGGPHHGIDADSLHITGVLKTGDFLAPRKAL